MAAAAAAVQASAGAAVGMRSLKKKGVTSSSIAEVEKTDGKVQGKDNGDELASAEVRTPISGAAPDETSSRRFSFIKVVVRLPMAS